MEHACCQDRQEQGGCPFQLHMDRVWMERRLRPGRLLLWYVFLALLDFGYPTCERDLTRSF